MKVDQVEAIALFPPLQDTECLQREVELAVAMMSRQVRS
jgi:hypothetical protein